MHEGFTRSEKTVTIANGQSLSGKMALSDDTLVGLVMPAGWTAAVLTFQVSYDGQDANLKNLYDADGNEIAVQAAVDRYIALDPSLWAGVRMIKIRSGTSAAAVAQGADRIIRLISRPV